MVTASLQQSTLRHPAEAIQDAVALGDVEKFRVLCDTTTRNKSIQTEID